MTRDTELVASTGLTVPSGPFPILRDRAKGEAIDVENAQILEQIWEALCIRTSYTSCGAMTNKGGPYIF